MVDRQRPGGHPRLLAGERPLPDGRRMRRIGDVHDEQDVRSKPGPLGRQERVRALEIEAVHTASGGAEEGDLPGRAAVRDIEDFEAHGRAAAAVVLGEAFVVHEHHVAGDAHLVRVDVARNAQLRDHARMSRVRDVENRGAVRRRHVADVRVPPVDDDLPSTRQIEIANRFERRTAGRTGHSDQSRSSATTACSIRHREAASGPRHS